MNWITYEVSKVLVEFMNKYDFPLNITNILKFFIPENP